MDKICAIEWVRQQPTVAPEEYHETNRQLLRHWDVAEFDVTTSSADEATIAILEHHGFEPREQSHLRLYGLKTEIERWYQPVFGVVAFVEAATGNVSFDTEFDDGNVVFSATGSPTPNRREKSVYLTYERSRLQEAIDEYLDQVTLKAEHQKIVTRSSLEQFEAHAEWYIVNHSSRKLASSANDLDKMFQDLGLDPNDFIKERGNTFRAKLIWVGFVILLMLMFLVFR